MGNEEKERTPGRISAALRREASGQTASISEQHNPEHALAPDFEQASTAESIIPNLADGRASPQASRAGGVRRRPCPLGGTPPMDLDSHWYCTGCGHFLDGVEFGQAQCSTCPHRFASAQSGACRNATAKWTKFGSRMEICATHTGKSGGIRRRYGTSFRSNGRSQEPECNCDRSYDRQRAGGRYSDGSERPLVRKNHWIHRSRCRES